jgi:hypothetical protein
MKKFMAGAAMAVAIAGGSVAVSAVNPLGIANAQTQEEAPSSEITRAERVRQVLREAGQQVSAALGISTDELRHELRSGKTLNQLADEHGVDSAVIEGILLDIVNQRVDQAVAEDRITETRAAEIRERAPERIEALMDRTFRRR